MVTRLVTYLLHLVDDKFLVAQILYLLDPSSATGFFIFLMVDRGSLISGGLKFYGRGRFEEGASLPKAIYKLTFSRKTVN
jgi:hypothetical protein